MNKTTISKPGAFRRIVSLFFLTAAAVAIVCAIVPSSAVNSNSARLPNQAAALAKIAPWVLDRTGTGQQAEFFIVLADQADISGAAALTTKQAKGRFVRDALWNKAQSTQGPLLTALAQKGVEYRSYYIVNMILVKGDFNLALDMASRADVARVEGNPVIRNIKNPLPVEKIVSKLETPTAVEPGVNYTKAPLVWALGYTGQGVVVGGADTGYRWTHNALKNKYRGWDGTTANHDFNWHDSVHSGGGSCGADSIQPCDDNGHGTHTMGTSVGDDGVTNQVGMAPGARWIGCRNMDQGNGTPSTYMECFEFFLAPYPVGGTPAQGNPALAPDVTTNSWSCPAAEGCSAGTLQAGVEAQRAAGIEMVVAAQNSGPNCSTVNDPPGIYEAAYTVGALTTSTDTIASFSSRGPITADGSNRTKPEISAPGTSTRSSYRTSDTAYANLSGTSMATPHIAGAMALLISAKPTLRHNTTLLQTYLNNSAEHISSTQCGVAGPPNNVYGYGRVNIKRAVSPIASAVSRKTHNLAGTFDVNLPLVGEPGIECRNSGGIHTLVFTFDGTPGTNDNVTGGTASVTLGTGVAGAPTFSGTTMTVPLTGVTDAQKITVTLQNVSGATWGPLPDVSVSVNMLVGDTNASKSVNSSDIGQTKGQLGQTVTAANFRQDVNADGGISSSDVTLVKAHNGAGVP